MKASSAISKMALLVLPCCSDVAGCNGKLKPDLEFVDCFSTPTENLLGPPGGDETLRTIILASLIKEQRRIRQSQDLLRKTMLTAGARLIHWLAIPAGGNAYTRIAMSSTLSATRARHSYSSSPESLRLQHQLSPYPHLSDSCHWHSTLAQRCQDYPLEHSPAIEKH